MKLLLIVDDFQNGAGNVAQLLALEWGSQGHEVSMLLTDCHSGPRYDLEQVQVHILNFEDMTGNRAVRFLKMVKGMRQVMEEVQMDLVISFLEYNNTIAGLSLRNKSVPLIASERNNVLELILETPWRQLRRIAYRRADIITVQFEAFRNFEGGRFAEKCRVTPNMIQVPASVKETWESSKVSFLALGRLTKRKRIDMMIELFAVLAQDTSNVELHIFGKGPEEQRLRKLIADKGLERQVFLDGYTSSVHQELLKHDVYLMTSELEGFPNSLSEAQAVGLPSVAFACHEGIYEMIEDGESGFVIPMDKQELFVEKMRLLAKDRLLRIRMGRRAQRIVDRYSKEQILQEWEACMKEAMEKR